MTNSKEVKKNIEFLENIPEKYKTPELCKIVIRRFGTSLEDVPLKYRTPELCKVAVEKCGMSLMDVPWEHRTPELYKMAVRESRDILDTYLENT